jgi:L-threonylcarbamoyladenylate synthase
MIGNDLHLSKKLLQQGELVAIPTETVYGLAANAFDPIAVAKIYEVKNRPSFNPLIIHTDSIEKLNEWGLFLPPKAQLLAEHYAPGPLTYVIPKSDRIPDIITAGTDAVAVRIPKHPLTLQLLASLDFPLAAPSANPSGFVSPTTASHVEEQLGAKIPYILDGGPATVGLESTILAFLSEEPTLLRYGGLALEDLEAVIGKINLPNQGFSDNPIAPGMLARHYATRHPILLGNPADNFIHYSPEEVAIIAFNKNYHEVPIHQQFILSPKGDITEAATQLFAAMRQANDLAIKVILAEIFPNYGLGRAINDRLKRAATP